MSGRIFKYSDEAYAEVANRIGEGIPLNEAWGGPNRPGKTAYWKKLQESPELQKLHEFAMTMRAQVRIAKIEDVIEKVLERPSRTSGLQSGPGFTPLAGGQGRQAVRRFAANRINGPRWKRPLRPAAHDRFPNGALRRQPPVSSWDAQR